MSLVIMWDSLGFNAHIFCFYILYRLLCLLGGKVYSIDKGNVEAIWLKGLVDNLGLHATEWGYCFSQYLEHPTLVKN